jgi:chaperonin cofactor prefoldin
LERSMRNLEKRLQEMEKQIQRELEAEMKEDEI